MPISANSHASGITCACAACRSTQICTPLPAAISSMCPSIPNPVTSVHACTLWRTITSRAARFSVIMTCSIRSVSAGLHSSALAAVVRTPIPKGLV